MVMHASTQYQNALVWFRRDLRHYDHAALYHALITSKQVYCVFVFDTDILDQLTDKADRRVEFIWHSVIELKSALQKNGGDLIMLHGSASTKIPALAVTLNINALFFNHDDEPSAISRDLKVETQLKQHHIETHHFKDHVIFERSEILTQSNQPYTVFTPYKNNWRKTLRDAHVKAYPVEAYFAHLAASETIPSAINQVKALTDIGFRETNLTSLSLPTGMQGGLTLFKDFKTRMHLYKDARNFPAVKGVSYLSVHLRFGTVSVRHLAREALHEVNAGSETWLNEIIWRDFYAQILYHNPTIAEGHAFKDAFDSLEFPNNPDYFAAWCEGRTGYPLVDAAMRQLNSTGYMHNRLRMVAASFLVKDLLIDWRWGEKYFAGKLIDFDFASNNGGWQWAASTGCDAQPWFRIFNPITQSEKFDQTGKFIRKYVPEISQLSDKNIHAPWLTPPLQQHALGISIGKDYPLPIVDHASQREKALTLYKSAKPN